MLPNHVLILDDEKAIRDSLQALFEDYEVAVSTAPDIETALAVIAQQSVDAAVVDVRLDGASGENFIRQAHALYPNMVFIIHTGSPNYMIATDVQRLKRVSKRVFNKPLQDLDSLWVEIQRLTTLLNR